MLLQYFRDAQPNHVVAIVKAREPARILIAIGGKDNASPHLECSPVLAAPYLKRPRELKDRFLIVGPTS